jgi:arsenate reductase
MKWIRSARVIAGAVAMLLAHGVSADDAKDSRQPSTVVFVCERGSSKSLLAATLFNRMAEERRLPVRAVSRAVSPETTDSRAPLRLVQKMTVDGFQVRTFQPRAVTTSEAAGADRVIVIGYDGNFEALGMAHVERWNDVPPASLEYENAKTVITSHIELLLQRLSEDR